VVECLPTTQYCIQPLVLKKENKKREAMTIRNSKQNKTLYEQVTAQQRSWVQSIVMKIHCTLTLAALSSESHA
jgi:hypothetical protein